MFLVAPLRRYAGRRHVRPWALCAPILVLIISIPMLRALRVSDYSQISDDEQSRLATVQAIVEHRTLAIEGTDFRDTRSKIVAASEKNERFPAHFYSKQPPMQAVLMSGPYWILRRFGLTLTREPSLVTFWLTLICVTIPVSIAAGLVYRMSKIFELKRPLRAALALVAVIGSGLISYSTVLNAHAPAAVFLLASASCLVHVILHNRPRRSAAWLGLAGLFASLAAAIDPPAIVFLVLFIAVIVSMRWTIPPRAIGIALYVIGASIPISIHTRLNKPITGDIYPGIFHPELAKAPQIPEFPQFSQSLVATPPTALNQQTSLTTQNLQNRAAPTPVVSASPAPSEDDEETLTAWSSFLHGIGRVFSAFVGWHGDFSHFPIVLLGIIGVSLIMHRHWPAATKMLAGATLGGALAIILIYAICRTTTRDAMFATRWFVVFLPLTIFWAGAWLTPDRIASVPGQWPACC